MPFDLVSVQPATAAIFTPGNAKRAKAMESEIKRGKKFSITTGLHGSPVGKNTWLLMVLTARISTAALQTIGTAHDVRVQNTKFLDGRSCSQRYLLLGTLVGQVDIIRITIIWETSTYAPEGRSGFRRGSSQLSFANSATLPMLAQNENLGSPRTSLSIRVKLDNSSRRTPTEST